MNERSEKFLKRVVEIYFKSNRNVKDCIEKAKKELNYSDEEVDKLFGNTNITVEEPTRVSLGWVYKQYRILI